MICAQCETRVTDDSRYCPQCGQATPLADAITPRDEAALVANKTADVSDAVATIRATSHIATPIVNAPVALTAVTDPLDTQKWQTQLSQANLCRMRRNWSAAIDHCVAVLQAQPANATAHSLLSDIYRDQGKLDDAIQWARLAIELNSTPADVAKLQKLEAERTHLMRQGDPRLLGSGLSRSMALAADGGAPNGTQNLMGVAPRKWLNHITTAAMVFVGAVLIVLLGLRYSRHDAPRRAFDSYASYPNPDTGVGLPSAPLPTRSSGLAAAPSASNSGLPPDLRTSTAAPRHRPNAPENLPPAPVLTVRPAPAPPAPAPQRRPGGAAIATTSSAAQSGDATALPNGMWIASVQFFGSGDARVKIGLRLADPDRLSATEREALTRNVYRAAKRIFENYDAVRQVAVTASNDPSDAVIFSANVDRANALTMNADTASASQLENALQSARWAAPEPTQNANSLPADGVPGVGP